MANRFTTCRFCKKTSYETYESSDMVQYGPRHHAHFKCYLDAGKTLDVLNPWKANQFPYFLLKERGLLSHPMLRRTESQS